MSRQPMGTNPQLEAMRSAFNNLSRGRQITIVAAVIGLIATFFHWYGASANIGAVSVSDSINGWHGWGYLAILGYVVAGILVLLPLTGRSVRALIPTLPPTATEARLIMGAGVVAALATILFMLTEGNGVSGPGYSSGPSFGAYLGLLCALAIVAGGFLMQQEPGAA